MSHKKKHGDPPSDEHEEDPEKRKKIPLDQRLIVVARDGGKCKYPGCERPVVELADAGDGQTELVWLGEFGHLHGVRPGGARYERSFPRTLINHHSNLALFCLYHGSFIDKKVLEHRYPFELLQDWILSSPPYLVDGRRAEPVDQGMLELFLGKAQFSNVIPLFNRAVGNERPNQGGNAMTHAPSSDEQARTAYQQEALQLAANIMAALEADPKILGHYLDTDHNDGEFLRQRLDALGIKPVQGYGMETDAGFLDSQVRLEPWRNVSSWASPGQLAAWTGEN